MMFDQTFALSDLPKIAVLSFIEILLSADNAVVLGLLAHRLPEALRKKALYIGVFSAFFLRAIALLCIAFVIQYQWIQILGAAYLLYLSLRHFVKKKGAPITPAGGRSFWKTVILIELFDLAFAVDSIVAGIAFIGTHETGGLHPKLWIVYIGGIIGLIGIRYASHLFSGLIHRFPRLETAAYLLIGWIGVKLAYNAFPLPLDLDPLFWIGTLLLLLFGFIKKKS
jgi:YkoY family integral membrane protein